MFIFITIGHTTHVSESQETELKTKIPKTDSKGKYH